MTTIANTFARLFARLALLIMAAVIAVVLIGFAVLGLIWIMLKALFTGRKPELVTSFMQFRQASQQFKRRGWSNQQARGYESSAHGDVIDGQAVEIRDDAALPNHSDQSTANTD